MRIILVLNKTLNRDGSECLDGAYYNFYIPLLELGHEVLFYDTVKGAPHSFTHIVDDFNPDLIFCCLTGNNVITPYEPWEEIEKITCTKKIKTFNWFCDDTWRFESFNVPACKKFTFCSTPEKKYIKKYKDLGYDNILLGSWHCSDDLCLSCPKAIDVGFCGGITPSRSEAFRLLLNSGVKLQHFHGLSYEDILRVYGSSRIVFNLTVNDNDVEKKKQMKLRIFEAVAAGSFLLTEYVEDLEDHFCLGKEIETFTNIDEAQDKIKHYLENPEAREKIATAGHRRFLKCHTSKIRLKNLLQAIK